MRNRNVVCYIMVLVMFLCTLWIPCITAHATEGNMKVVMGSDVADGGLPTVLVSDTDVVYTAIDESVRNTPNQVDGIWQISDADQLIWFAEYVNAGNSNANAILLDDIDLEDRIWTPIGNGGSQYRGTFDGQFHRIKNMDIAGTSYQGLFGCVNGGVVIKNTIIDSTCSIDGTWGVGGLVGVAPMGGGTVTIENCGNEAAVTGSGSSVAGILGGCFDSAGTLIIRNCYNVGDIRGTKAAGICGGATQNPDNSFINCYNAGIISGANTGTIFYGSTDTLDNCYGLNSTESGINSFSEEMLMSGELTLLLNGSDYSHGIWRQTLEQDNFPNFTGRKVFYSEGENMYYNSDKPAQDAGGVYQINTADELMWFATYVEEGNSNIDAVLLNDIDLSDKDVVPIGTSKGAYNGTFDGQFYRIKNMVINGTSYQGLFGRINNGAVIKNIIIDSSCSVSGTWGVGGLVGVAQIGGTITIENCGNEANVTGSGAAVAGILGQSTDKSGTIVIKNCYNTGNIKGSQVAGICGIASATPTTVIRNCYNTGVISGTGTNAKTGTIFNGTIDSSDVLSNCYSLNPTENIVIPLDIEDIVSGKLTYLLNGGEGSENVWKQTLEKDTYPSFIGESVYYWERSDVYRNEPEPVPLSIKGGDRNLKLGNVRYLKYEDNISDGVATPVFTSSNEEVTSITEDGILIAESLGNAIITLTLTWSDGTQNETTSINVNVVEDSTDEEFILMKQRWLDYLLITDLSGTKYSTIIEKKIQELSEEAENLWESMCKPGTNDTPLWVSISQENGGIAKDQFKNLWTLTAAFVTEGTTLYQDHEVGRTLLNALEYMTGTGDYDDINYAWTYDGIHKSGGWWNWQIGASQPFSYILLVMESYLDEEEIIRYTDIINQYCYDPIMQLSNSGTFGSPAEPANLCDIAQCVLIQGLLGNNVEQITRITDSDCVSSVMATKDGYSSFGNGQYEDGSYIAHTSIAYNGSYGAEALKGIAIFCNVLGGTSYDFSADTIRSWYEYMIDAYLPLLYKGKMMSMVNGRAVSRAHSGQGAELYLGKQIMNRMLMLCENATGDYKEIIQGVIKYNLEELVEYYGESVLDNEISFFELLDDDSIQSMTYLDGIKIFGAMCRIVQATDNYTAGLALSRNHISSYESINGENFTGYYQGTGALFIYNNDLNQFGGDFWPTQDPYRLAGITADTKALITNTDSIWPPKTATNKVAGGASNGTLASIAYQFDGSFLNIDTWAKKSYFFFENGIVQMGTDISGSTDGTIETTIEARLLNEDGSNIVLINDKEFEDRAGKQTIHLEAGSWIHLEGNCEGADMAYYFPADIDIEIDIEQRTGSYSDIHLGEEAEYTEEHIGWYFNLGINHGTGIVQNEQYLYVTLPGMSVDEIKNYAACNTLKIVDGVVEDGNLAAHFIQNNNDTMLAVNYFGGGNYKADWMTLTPGVGCISLIVTEDEGMYTLSVADPSYSDATLMISSDYKMNVINKSKEITIAENNMSFTVDTTAAGGHSFQLSFTLEGKEPTINWPTAGKINYGKSLEDIQLTGGSTKGSFQWLEPETIPAVGTSTYTLKYTTAENLVFTKEISVTVEEYSGSKEGNSGNAFEG